MEGAPNNGTEGSLYHLLRDPPVLPAGKNYLHYDIPEYPSNGDYEQRANATDCTCQKPEVGGLYIRLPNMFIIITSRCLVPVFILLPS